MPINQYSVLKGTPLSGSISKDSRPHYLIELSAGSVSWQIAVNVESDTGSGSSAEVLYALDEDWTPPDAAALAALPMGATSLAGKDANPAIDYLRSRTPANQPLITRAAMTDLPLPGKTAAQNLQNAVIQYLNQAIADKDGTIYAFGALYTSGNGIHDIHMNQGNPANDHASDNGIWQDGLLVFSMPNAPAGASQWTAIFIAFQEQVWSTDNSGNVTS
ncbi:DUF2278 family protein [Acidipila sp. EB88]|uniref:DUF2278 family protein n=1 Tax=Acidipila sp. EB88 TaxID=2305226 RepID=UPI000F604060|nr:DUF2278 family protein [Acidipila sp. EB88]RRA48883.1 DUF2278 family protein [Acidipila sp. EB88]